MLNKDEESSEYVNDRNVGKHTASKYSILQDSISL